MVFETDPYVQRAREHRQSNDPQRLYYACLELRYALERIAFQKLQLRLDKITIDEIAAWQPGRAMERLMELVDEHLNQTSLLKMATGEANTDADGDRYVLLGETTGLDPKKIGKHWQKLSSYLHIRMPEKKGDRPRDRDTIKLGSYVDEVISYVEEIARSKFDAHFSTNVTVKCGKCGQHIVRNANLLKENDVVQCQNPNCDASYIAQRRGDNHVFERHSLHMDCLACGERTFFDANKMLKVPYTEARAVVCPACSRRHQVRWNLQYALVAEAE